MKIQEVVPFYMRNFLTMFNNVKFLNKANITEVFIKYLDHPDSAEIPNDHKFEVLSKPLDNKNLIISSSTVTLIKSLLECVIHLLIYDSLVFETFLNIFNIFDYYILACIHMFIDKKQIALLFEEVNIEEIKKKPTKLEAAIDIILVQKRFSNIRKFMLRTKKSLEGLFEIQLDFLKNSYDNESYDITEFNLPKLNSEIIVNDSNSYILMIESIIAYESIISVYKIIKRLRHFSKVRKLLYC
jgi:hypothetical protein